MSVTASTARALISMGVFLWVCGLVIVVASGLYGSKRPRRAERMWLLGGANVAGVTLATIGGLLVMAAIIKIST